MIFHRFCLCLDVVIPFADIKLNLQSYLSVKYLHIVVISNAMLSLVYSYLF